MRPTRAQYELAHARYGKREGSWSLYVTHYNEFDIIIDLRGERYVRRYTSVMERKRNDFSRLCI
ncbi:hypothetical protein GCM10011384_00750 [Psychrobacillus lasiicapitis]|nr:hypothetical protein GCM10011384_00750 [Psychrobacillus lasiicapitis]